jgi:hypothetical protein
MNFSITQLLLILFVLYIIYTFTFSETYINSPNISHEQLHVQTREQQYQQHEQQREQLHYQQSEINTQENLADLVKINILEKPQYSIERELIVDDGDTAFYKAHFNEYASDGFDGYGIYTPQGDGELSSEILQKLSKGKNDGLDAWDSTIDNFAIFDKNEKGYLGTRHQNVHSSLVQDTIKNKYQEAKKKTSHIPSRDTQTEIIKFARYLKKDVGKLQNIINQIKERNSFVKHMNDTEINVLNNSWISANNNVKEQIINELLDITDGKDYIVCPTGVTSRIINANIVENPESSPIKEEDLRKEMLQSASKIKAELDKSNSFRNLSDIDQNHFFKEKLIQKFNKDYDGIISRDRIKKEFEIWINDI